MAYAVKGVKTFRGREGEGYNATLYRDGKKVAFVTDDASGGQLDIDWEDIHAPRTTVQVEGYEKGKSHPVNMTPEEKALHDHCLPLPDRLCSFLGRDGKPVMMRVTPEIFVEDLVNDYILLKDAAKLTKGKVAFLDKGKIYTIKLGSHTEEATIAHVKSKHPEAMILNGRQPSEVLAAMRAVQG